ncbi:MAG: hypothetical protein HON04_00190 [Planctomicrobium sp.]|nr:hypothetical protein [Planctomicrobium sp.]
MLTTDAGRRHLRSAIEEVKAEAPFDIIAIILLPDHFHAMVL